MREWASGGEGSLSQCTGLIMPEFASIYPLGECVSSRQCELELAVCSRSSARAAPHRMHEWHFLYLTLSVSRLRYLNLYALQGRTYGPYSFDNPSPVEEHAHRKLAHAMVRTLLVLDDRITRIVEEVK